MMQVRSADAAEIEHLAQLWYDGWHQAHASLVPQELTRLRTTESFRERLQAGDSDAQVLDFLVARYGEFVLLRPRLSWRTAVLWGLPPGLLLSGIALLVVASNRRRGRVQDTSPNLTPSEQARLKKILAESSGP